MRFDRLAAPVLVVLLLAPLVSADVVELKSGRRVRGFGLTKVGSDYRITREEGDVVFIRGKDVAKITRRKEMVEFRGETVTLAEKVRTLRKETEKRRRTAMRQLETWVKGGKKAEDAKAKFSALAPAYRVDCLAHTLAKSTKKEARLLAARELGASKSNIAVQPLVEAAVRDRYRSVRDGSLSALQNLPATKDSIAQRFAPFLRSSSSRQRTYAANALSVFPSRRVMPDLIGSLEMSWSGFGRAVIFRGTQRSYIGDYELVSGGAGFSIVEVADPVIRTSSTGVVADVHVRRVELRARLRVMFKISRQEFGTDVKRWREWWREDVARRRVESPQDPSAAPKPRGA